MKEKCATMLLPEKVVTLSRRDPPQSRNHVTKTLVLLPLKDTNLCAFRCDPEFDM